MQFHSHLSSGKMQNAATTHNHMKKLIEELIEEKLLLPVIGVIFDNTDGCSKQYRCANAIYLLSLLAATCNITIDRAIGCAGHGKDIVDGLNAVDKAFLMSAMMVVVAALEEGTNKKIQKTEVDAEGQKKRLETEAARLLSDRDRLEGVKGHAKHAKRERERAMKKRVYHVRDPNDNIHDNLKMTLDQKGLISHMHHIHVDPNLGATKAAVRRIPCACFECTRMLRLPWDFSIESPEDQPRFKTPTSCKCAQVLEDWNKWTIVTCIPTKDTDKDDVEGATEEVLVGIAERMGQEVEEGNVGAIAMDDDKILEAPITLK